MTHITRPARRDKAAVERRRKDIKLVSAWREELAAKVRRSELLFEHFGIDIGYEKLTDEVTGFKAVVAGIEKSGEELPQLRVIKGGRSR